MANWDIRQDLLLAGIRQWRVAESLGISESMLSKMLRKELSKDKKDEIKLVIKKLAAEKREVL